MTISRAHVITQIFSIPEQRCYAVTAKNGNFTKIYSINAGSAEEILHRKTET